MGGAWLQVWHPDPAGRPLLLCVPPAGAGCGQFRSWQELLGDRIAVAGIQLPGREDRWAEPEPESLAGVVAAIRADLTGLAAAPHPVVVFGHSFGGLIGYELARSLARDCGWPPRALVVAACRPPGMWVGAGRGLVDSDGELAGLLDARGLDPGDLDPESRDLLLDVLRRDARLSLSFAPAGPHAVGCPLEVWGGEQDAIVSPTHLSGWREYAAGPFRTRIFPGGHYFCLSDPGPALAVLGPLAEEPACAT